VQVFGIAEATIMGRATLQRNQTFFVGLGANKWYRIAEIELI
jgi:hypothetical protein